MSTLRIQSDSFSMGIYLLPSQPRSQLIPLNLVFAWMVAHFWPTVTHLHPNSPQYWGTYKDTPIISFLCPAFIASKVPVQVYCSQNEIFILLTIPINKNIEEQ
jgi:hypothetical protein